MPTVQTEPNATPGGRSATPPTGPARRVLQHGVRRSRPGLPIYSGGLGVLAGDHLKAAADLGLPLVGVGLFYRGGYFAPGR